jgi:hypothetical protein
LQGCTARLAAHAQYAPVAALQLDLDRARAHRQLHLANVRMFYVGRLQAAHGTRVRRRRDVRVGCRDRDGARVEVRVGVRGRDRDGDRVEVRVRA